MTHIHAVDPLDMRVFPPSPEFAAAANAGPELQAAAGRDRLAFWDEQAQRLYWHGPWTEVLDWSDAPVAKWFVGGKLNVAYNCVDRHVLAGNGERVAIYMPMIPEAIIAMLACARLGLTHSVVFGGFSSHALRSRIDDAEAKLVVTVDGQWRRGNAAPLKPAVDQALADDATDAGASSVEHVLAVKRAGNDVEWTEGRDLWWHETVDKASPEHEG